MMSSEIYSADYYLNGPAQSISNYVNYSWKPVETLALAKRIITLLDLRPALPFYQGEATLAGSSFLDIGCARGYLVRALRMCGIEAWGQDISRWAIEQCDPEIQRYVSNQLPDRTFHTIWMKDVLEHVPATELEALLLWVAAHVEKSVLAIVPLTEMRYGPYLRAEDNQDRTHVIKWPLQDWMSLFADCFPPERFMVSGSWHLPGLKPASTQVPRSCGFLRVERI